MLLFMFLVDMSDMYHRCDLKVQNIIFAQSMIEKNKENPLTLEQIATIKRGKIGTYPYYPIVFASTQNKIRFLFCFDFNLDEPKITVMPFQGSNRMGNYNIEPEGLPKKPVTIFHVLEMKDEIAPDQKSIVIASLDCVIGFIGGYLVRCLYTHSARTVKNPYGKREFTIVQKLNKKPPQKQSLMMRMSSAFYTTDEWYLTNIDKPVRSFQEYPNCPEHYRYSYQVGDRILLTRQLTEQAEQDLTRIYNSISWADIPQKKPINLATSTVMQTQTYESITTAKSMMINFFQQVCSFVYVPSTSELIVATNEDNKIEIYDIKNTMKLKTVFKLDYDVKKIVHTDLNGYRYLLVMPYHTSLFIIDLEKKAVGALKGHKSYIGNAMITRLGCIITAGCDHRIGLKKVSLINNWKMLADSENNRKFIIECEKIGLQNFGEIYFLGEFKNVNEFRSNNYDYGFGNFLSFGENDRAYAFLTYDFLVKIFSIDV